jgi:ArsR family transcriptional regulator
VQRLRSLADEIRIRILLRLKEGECNVSALVEELGVAQTSVSKHLSVLRHSGVVSLRREGTQSFYSLKDESVFTVLQLSCESMKRVQREVANAISASGSFEI